MLMSVPAVTTNEPLAMRKQDCGFYFDYLRLFCSHISTSSAPLFYLAAGGGGGGRAANNLCTNLSFTQLDEVCLIKLVQHLIRINSCL